MLKGLERDQRQLTFAYYVTSVAQWESWDSKRLKNLELRSILLLDFLRVFSDSLSKCRQPFLQQNFQLWSHFKLFQMGTYCLSRKNGLVWWLIPWKKVQYLYIWWEREHFLDEKLHHNREKLLSSNWQRYFWLDHLKEFHLSGYFEGNRYCFPRILYSFDSKIRE